MGSQVVYPLLPAGTVNSMSGSHREAKRAPGLGRRSAELILAGTAGTALAAVLFVQLRPAGSLPVQAGAGTSSAPPESALRVAAAPGVTPTSLDLSSAGTAPQGATPAPPGSNPGARAAVGTASTPVARSSPVAATPKAAPSSVNVALPSAPAGSPAAQAPARTASAPPVSPPPVVATTKAAPAPASVPSPPPSSLLGSVPLLGPVIVPLLTVVLGPIIP